MIWTVLAELVKSSITAMPLAFAIGNKALREGEVLTRHFKLQEAELARSY